MNAEHTASTDQIVNRWAEIIAPARSSCHQERSWQRLLVSSCGLLTALGRHTLSQVIVTTGHGEEDWSAWYRLFNAARIDWEEAQRQLLKQVEEQFAVGKPLTVVLDGTHLPRTSRRMPGVGWARQPRTPVWMTGIHLTHRWVGMSAVLPRSSTGDSRTVPVRFVPACAPRAVPLQDHDPLSEGEAGRELLSWLRTELDGQGAAERMVLAVGDGAYGSARMRQQLPERTVLLSRCHRNRALFALPEEHPSRGRKRQYGDHLPTPHELLLEQTGFTAVPVTIRGRLRRLQVKVVGPVLIRPAADHPLFLLVVKGYTPNQRGATHHREAIFYLVDAQRGPDGQWRLPYPLAELIALAWQRWEVEVMHRELKSGFGLGQQQQWSSAGLVAVVQWITWLYGTLILAAYTAWGYQPPGSHRLGCWWEPRRWSLATLWQTIRREIWQLAEFLPVWSRTPDRWGAITAWFAAPDNPLAGYRRI